MTMHADPAAHLAPMSPQPLPDAAAELSRDERLKIAMPRRMVVQYGTNEVGARQLDLYYGDKQVSFDEPEMFAFGEALAKQTVFRAGDAASWGPDYTWPQVRALLAELVREGVLEPAVDGEVVHKPFVPREQAANLPPVRAAEARTWDACEAITLELAGRAIEPGYLELIVPVFRVAHITLDADGRQVGEANVFPRALRVETPTKWGVCPYSGTRYMVERPMNVTALKCMRDHWPQMMAALARIRSHFMARFGRSAGHWTVGEVERLATMVLSVVTYPVVRHDRRVANGSLHPALSSLFRVTDGLRMVMHQMMFVPIGEPALPAETPVSSDSILAYAERNYSFHSETGVCAGPATMVREFLEILVDGRRTAETDETDLHPAVQAALADIDAAFDYGLHGLRSYAASYSVWPVMVRHYEELAAIMAAAASDGGSTAEEVRARFASRLETIRRGTFLASEDWRVSRERAYEDMYRNCGLGIADPALPLSLSAQIGGEAVVDDRALADAITGQVMAYPGLGLSAATARAIGHCLAGFAVRLQAILRVACASQAAINDHLGRPQPQRLFSGLDVNVHNTLLEAGERQLPYLLDEIADVFGLHLMVDANQIALAAPGNGRHDRAYRSDGANPIRSLRN